MAEPFLIAAFGHGWGGLQSPPPRLIFGVTAPAARDAKGIASMSGSDSVKILTLSSNLFLLCSIFFRTLSR
ncbi:hypothetical protein A6A40_06110 [Azospirillum humicireducens]|uniref:Uncharacterized protein n=1 Tax=Azospirillum humicireducens TaxID=1226968 RepID=A0A160JF83_9PROT|nr:hypothetical protein [Azospirillum humicireducens]ANC91510.1 hypothetical protein A6A40_06110 [Azospirillum humicireducens]